MPEQQLKSLAKSAGISLKKAEGMWKKAKVEAKAFKQEDNYAYVMDIFKSMVGLDEESIKQTTQHLTTRFIESKYTIFSEFLEAIVVGKLEELTSLSGFTGETPSENPLAIVTIGNPDKKRKIKPGIKSHIDDYKGTLPTGTTDPEKNAKKIGFKVKPDSDPFSKDKVKRDIKEIPKSELEVGANIKEAIKPYFSAFGEEGAEPPAQPIQSGEFTDKVPTGPQKKKKKKDCEEEYDKKNEDK